MPTYSYVCKQCGHSFDAVQSFTDPALTTCEVCGGPLHKHYGSIGVTFKGSGFYRTDSRRKPTASVGAGSTHPSSPATPAPSTAATTGASSPATPSAAPAS